MLYCLAMSLTNPMLAWTEGGSGLLIAILDAFAQFDFLLSRQRFAALPKPPSLSSEGVGRIAWHSRHHIPPF